MRIEGNENGYGFMRLNQRSTPKGLSFFYSCLNSAAASRTANEQPTATFSPVVRLGIEYDEWKEQREPQTLPDSKGATEENIAYLKSRYSHSLSRFERIEALETMREMEIIDRRQFNIAVYGDPLDLIEAKAGITMGPLEEGRGTADYSQWLNALPISQLDSLDDLFAMLDSLKKDGAFEKKEDSVLEQILSSLPASSVVMPQV